MNDESAEDGQWDVVGDHEHQSVVISFNEMSPDGVQSFWTAMPPECAMNLAIAIISHATCVMMGPH